MESKLINCPHCGRIISIDTLKGEKSQKPSCPECGSQRNYKDGIRQTKSGEIQRYLCRDCSYRFSPK